jgi:hypothetical protein
MPGRPRTANVEHQGAWEEVLTVSAEDAEVLQNLLGHGHDVAYDVQRRVLMFGTTPVGQR